MRLLIINYIILLLSSVWRKIGRDKGEKKRRDNGGARNFIRQRFANAKSKGTVDNAFHIAGKKEIFNKTKDLGKTQCIHFAERKRNRDREARAHLW